MGQIPTVDTRARKGDRARSLSMWYALHPGWRPAPGTPLTGKAAKRKAKIERRAKRKAERRRDTAAQRRRERDRWLRANAKRLRSNPTPEEVRMRELLREWRIHGFRFQSVFGEYIPDFRSDGLALVIEVDGAFHQNDPRQVAYDARRTAYLERFGYRVIRFTNAEVMQTPEHVESALRSAIAASTGVKRRRT